MKTYRHRDGRWPCGYLRVEVDEAAGVVWGVRKNGSRIITNWHVEDVETFEAKGHWIPESC